MTTDTFSGRVNRKEKIKLGNLGTYRFFSVPGDKNIYIKKRNLCHFTFVRTIDGREGQIHSDTKVYPVILKVNYDN